MKYYFYLNFLSLAKYSASNKTLFWGKFLKKLSLFRDGVFTDKVSQLPQNTDFTNRVLTGDFTKMHSFTEKAFFCVRHWRFCWRMWLIFTSVKIPYSFWDTGCFIFRKEKQRKEKWWLRKEQNPLISKGTKDFPLD